MKSEVPISPEQRWEWIKYQLRSSGSNLSRLAAELDVSDSAAQLAKYVPYPRIERAIAKKLGRTPLEIWPERWNADGTPARHRPQRAEKRTDECKSGEQTAHICAKDSGSNAIAHRQLARGA